MPNKIADDELSLFRDAVRGVKRMETTKIEKVIKPVKRKRQVLENDNVSASIFSDHETLDPVTSDCTLTFNQPGIQHKTLRKLRTGQYNVEGILDLHGMTVLEASEALHQFFLRCKQENLRHVLIVHGKGRDQSQPKLKNKLNHWLRQTEQVLAFCSATNKDGRTGALYVLLKNYKGGAFFE
jgi:DNA-nicking Smr family endonuclease